MSDLAYEVRRRAGGHCEYCRLPQAAFRRPFHIEHIVARQHGGSALLDNLALACWRCNVKKGPNLAGVDPETRQIVPLFHPRNQQWEHHFALRCDTESVEILGLTPEGRATVRLLGLNDEMQRMLRHQLWSEGLYGR